MKGLQEIAMSRIELKTEKSLICGWPETDRVESRYVFERWILTRWIEYNAIKCLQMNRRMSN